MNKPGYRRCIRCIMDTTDAEIRFDAAGHCNHCSYFLDHLAKLTYQGSSSDAQLSRIVETIRHAGRHLEFDCVLGLSGGIDSSYAAYTLKRLGLRPLCVHLDNGWDSDISIKNIKHIVSKLDIGYQSEVLDWEEFKDLQLAFLRASVPEAETPTDIAIQAIVYGAAKRHGIKYIISGGNFATEGILPKSWHYDAKDVTYLRAIHKLYGTRRLETFPLFDYKKWIYFKLKGLKTIYLLNFVPYSKELAMNTLEKELAWRYYGGKHYESRYTGFVQSYLLFEKFAIDYRLPTLSTQICMGETTREAALADLARKPYDPEKIAVEKQYVSKKLGISVAEFDAIMAAPPKSHQDYPNDKRLLEFLYRTYRRLKLRKF